MNKIRLTGIISMAAVIVLELLPFGAVLNFAIAPGGSGGYIRETHSYFSILPIGYANYGPFLTALLSCVLLTLWIYGAVFECGERSFVVTGILTGLAIFTSVIQFTHGITYLSVVGVLITIILAVGLVFSVIGAKMSGRGGKFA